MMPGPGPEEEQGNVQRIILQEGREGDRRGESSHHRELIKNRHQETVLLSLQAI
jgi:hypothetical protein